MRSIVSAFALLLAAFSLAGCAHKQPPPPAPKQIFHYRALARPIAPGTQFETKLDGNSQDKFADAVRFHFDKIGVLKLTTGIPTNKVAVLVFTSGKKAMVQSRANKELDTPPISGDVFVVVRAIKNSGPIHVQLDSTFEVSPVGTAETPPTGPPDLELGTAPGAEDPEMSLDGL